MKKVSVTVIIVGHQSAEELAELIPGLISQATELGLEIIVIENASTDDSESVLRRFGRDIRIVTNGENIGFAAAVNQGLRLARAPYILLLNPDARLPASGLTTLKLYLDERPGVAAVAPRIEFPDGRIQPSRGSFPSVFRTLAHLSHLKRIMPDDEIVINGPLKILGRLFRQYAPLLPVDEIVDYTTGACVLLRRSAVEEVGGMDESFFLYYEEIDLARRLKDEGYRWVFLGSVSAVHSVAASSGKAPLRPFYERYKSMCYYFRKHHHPFSAFVVRQLMYMMIFIRWGLAMVSQRFRLDPKVPLEEEIDTYRKLVRKRTRPVQ